MLCIMEDLDCAPESIIIQLKKNNSDTMPYAVQSDGCVAERATSPSD